ncbi:MAG: Hsp70 family protein [Acidobacteriota bacterium]
MKGRCIIGIDLGTTNSAVAYIRTGSDEFESPEIVLYEVPQLVAPGEGAPCRTLPSFLYIAGDYDIAAESLWLPWDEQSRYAVGTFARDQGALVPGRLVSSAKSWLCYSEVDRTAKILPWGSDLGPDACSPVEVSARYLKHIRDAWNFEFAGESPDMRFENQEIVLTVPASFDEEARELTLQAAREAGFNNLTLIEEPLAAFYSWIVAHNRHFEKYVVDGDLILVCDVGGGTTDFSLIRVTRQGADVRFERTAVGEHLLLGGDNVDHALARLIETRLARKLTIQQRAALLRQCSAAKEQLLDGGIEEKATIRLAGSGSSLVGGTLQADLIRQEVLDLLLDGFLPITARDDLPRRERRTALREIGLPYESEPAITRHLAAFLHQASQQSLPVRPDAILFNGGFFKPTSLRERLAQAVAQWFATDKGWSPKILSNDSLDTAVAVGAAYYGLVRYQGGVRVGSGSPRAYYIEVARASQAATGKVEAVCVLPRGSEEGTTLQLDTRLFELQANRPVSFTLWSSTTRQGDALGDIIIADEEELHAHSPLVTVIRFGKRTSSVNVPVKLVAEFTEVGTLELWCQSRISEHRWRLQFQLRKPAGQVSVVRKPSTPITESAAIVDEAAVQAACDLITNVFQSRESNPIDLTGQLEEIFSLGRDSWPMVVIRKLADHLWGLVEGRRLSEKHEARWLNLFGFCLRPGFGAELDDWRVQQARKLYHTGLAFPNDEQCQAEWMVLWRRVAGGFTKGQQLELYNRTSASLMGGRGRRRVRLNPQVERETWRMAASLELLPAAQKVELGQALLARISSGIAGENELWSLGRLGARIPFAATIDTVLPPTVVMRWIEILLTVDIPAVEAFAATLVQLAARTDDPVRDIGESLRAQVAARLIALGKPALVDSIETAIASTRRDAARIFGESLPVGLRLLQ